MDGQFCAGATFSGTPLLMKSGQTMRIGNSAGGELMDGSIDEVRIYDRALSASEIKRLYDMGR